MGFEFTIGMSLHMPMGFVFFLIISRHTSDVFVKIIKI